MAYGNAFVRVELAAWGAISRSAKSRTVREEPRALRVGRRPRAHGSQMRFTTSVAEAPRRHPGGLGEESTARGIHALARSRARPAVRRLPRPLGVVGRRARSVLGVDLGFFEVEASQPYERVLGRREMPGAEWFPGARLSVRGARVPRPRRRRGRDRPRLGAAAAGGDDVGRAARADRRDRGRAARPRRRPGDRVAALPPEHPRGGRRVPRLRDDRRGLVVLRARLRRPRSVVDRFAQIEPKVLLAVDGYRYGGRDFTARDASASSRAALPSLERTVVLPYLGRRALGTLPGDALRRAEGSSSRSCRSTTRSGCSTSSGTTGLPKAIVHGQGGILLEHLKKLRLHLDAQAGDRVFWFTTTGWMMWNFLVGGLLPRRRSSSTTATRLPGPRRALGSRRRRRRSRASGRAPATSPRAMKAGVEPAAGRDLSRLAASARPARRSRPRASTGCYDAARGGHRGSSRRAAAPTSCTAFVGGVPTLPVYAASCRHARSARRSRRSTRTGARSSARSASSCITEPMPSMPLYLWDDEDGSRYRESYFSTYPRRVAPRRLDRDHRARHGDHHRPLRRDDQPRRRPDGDERAYAACSRSTRSSTPWSSTCRTGTQPHVALRRRCARAPTRRRARRRDQAPIREDCSPRHVPDEIVAAPADPAHAVGEDPRGAGETDPDGRAAGGGREPRLACEPRGARLVRLASRQHARRPEPVAQPPTARRGPRGPDRRAQRVGRSGERDPRLTSPRAAVAKGVPFKRHIR